MVGGVKTLLYGAGGLVRSWAGDRIGTLCAMLQNTNAKGVRDGSLFLGVLEESTLQVMRKPLACLYVVRGIGTTD